MRKVYVCSCCQAKVRVWTRVCKRCGSGWIYQSWDDSSMFWNWVSVGACFVCLLLLFIFR